MKRTYRTCAVSIAAVGTLLMASCGEEGGADFDPAAEAVEVVVHTGPGGGSDVFARAVTDMLREGNITANQWMVQNIEGGSGAQAMSNMVQQGGNDDVIAAVTMTWLTTPLTVGEGMVSLSEFTPIAQVLTEPTFIAVRDDAPYETMEDLVDASVDGESITQVGGSPTAHASIVGDLIQNEIGAEWRFLSFSGGGERVSALLGGDADLMLGSAEDFDQHVRGGNMRLLAVAEPERLESHPDVPTLDESGVSIDPPDQVRGFVGPPDMDPELVQSYEDVFRELSESDEWDEYLVENGWVGDFAGSEEWGNNITGLEEELATLFDQLGIEISS